MKPSITVYPHGRPVPEVTWPGDHPEVTIKDRGCELVIVFDDKTGDGNVLELRIRPDTDKLEPRVLRQFAPQAELYVNSARAAMKMDVDDLRGAVEALRAVGRPGRGLTEEFYDAIGRDYVAFVREGEPYPVKAIGEKHHVTISAASRWVKEARARGYVPRLSAQSVPKRRGTR